MAAFESSDAAGIHPARAPEDQTGYQTDDAATRIRALRASNIAEGFGRFGNKEFARFARMSKGSLHESLNHLMDARDQRMITGDELLIEEHHIKKAIKP